MTKTTCLLLGLAASAAITAWVSDCARAQAVPPSSERAAEELRRNPDLVRQRLRRSGLTPLQIRARLRAAGYPENLLDPYLEEQEDGDVVRVLGSAELGALQALGLPFAAANDSLGADTGFVTREPQPPSRVFGVNTFRRNTTQFLPLLSGPVPPTYRIGPGDILVLILTGDVELTHTLTVSREGFMLIRDVGQVHVANLTLEELRAVLFDRLGRVYSGVRRGARATTHFDVSVVSVRANQIYVVGEVMQPGAYQISALGTVLSALYAAGGVTEDASLRRIEIRRGGTVVATMDLYDYLLAGNTRNDIRLETGDVVFVPVHGPRVDVIGAVVRSGIYELVLGDVLPRVIEAAGGFRANADLRRITVLRILPISERGPGPALRSAIAIELHARNSGAGDNGNSAAAGVLIPSFTLHDGDSVVVDSLPPLAASYYVGIAGMVRKPGAFPWREGMTLRDLVDLARGPRVGADLRAAEIARMPRDRGAGVLADTLRVPLDSSYLLDRDSLGRYVGPPGPDFPTAGSAPEVVLQPYDQVLILRQPQFELQRMITISGEVQFPGPYALTRKDERLSDLVRRAGGLLESAYPAGARVIRERDNAGRVNIDLVQALAGPRGRHDIILQPGDSVDIPEFVPTVRVEGAVNAPTSVLYRQGAGLDYYVANAGGYAHNADKGRVSVRYANGSARVKSRFLFFSSSPEPGPGSTVFVPVKEDGPGFDFTGFLTAFAQIMASTVAIIAIASR